MVSKVAPSFHSEVIVVGAGVIGLAITRALAKAGKEVLLLEKNSSICAETSSRNSEVIHAVRFPHRRDCRSQLWYTMNRSLLY